MVARGASAVANGDMYCCISDLLYGYNVSNNKWRPLPRLVPYGDGLGEILLVFHEELGALMPLQRNIVYSIRDGRWYKNSELRIMPWAILYHQKHFLLFGLRGELQAVRLSTTPIVTEECSIITSPNFSYASTVICNGAIYLIGSVFNTPRHSTNQVFRIPRDPAKSSWLGFFKSKNTKPWEEVAALPVSRSTGVCFKGHLLAIGGCQLQVNRLQACGDIFLYEEWSDEWLVIGKIPTPRYSCLVEVVGDQLVVVGGWLDHV